jgi:hypothetical protein
MSIFEKDFLRRVKSPKAPAKTQEPLRQSGKVSEQHSLEQQPARVEQLEQVIKRHQLEQEKGGWRSSSKWLEENYPEEFGASKAVRSSEGQRKVMSDDAPTSQPLPIAPGFPQSVPEVPNVTPSITLLPSGWWQAFLYGSRDAMFSAVDVNIALQLVARKLGKDSDVAEFSGSVRVNTLRKLLDERFGAAQTWRVMNELWRAAPASPGVLEVNVDQSHCTPGVWECPRSMPAWRREFYQEVSDEQRLLESMGGWCG